jgi:hypothetical protein
MFHSFTQASSFKMHITAQQIPELDFIQKVLLIKGLAAMRIPVIAKIVIAF